MQKVYTTTVIVIALHPTEELRLIKLQKELVKEFFVPGGLVHAHQPLWIETGFESVDQAKKEIKSVSILAPEYEDEWVVCPVKIEKVDGSVFEGKLNFIDGLPHRSAPSNDEGAQTFPLALKIFRLGECTSPSPGVYELCNVVWKKLS
ncbi:MAG: hypothetical protein IK102_01405 [Treponema sp.]|nr:hypothetical protein [Treponema sp.]